MHTTVNDAAETRAMRERFPKLSKGAAAFQAALIVLFNAYLLKLVLDGDLSPLAIAVFAILDITLLSVIGNLAVLMIPKSSRVGDPGNDRPIRKFMAILIFLGFVVGMYYASVLFDTDAMERFVHAPGVMAAFAQLRIGVPLLLSTLLTASMTIQDILRWRQRGGLFMPGYAVPAAAKFITLLLAPVPALILREQFGVHGQHSAILAWSLTYLGIKCAIELGMLAFQCSSALDSKS